MTEKKSVKSEKSVPGRNGGARPGAGRKPGATNKRTLELVEAAIAGGVMPLDYMLAVMRNEKEDPDMRFEAAKASAPYLHAKLASIEVNANVSLHEDGLDQLA